MATEKYTNDAVTTLNGAILAGDLALVVNSFAGFPPAAQYRILIDNEILLVTAGAGTLNWTVVRAREGTVAAGHANGATVIHDYTAGAVDQIRADQVQTGAVAARVAEKAGNLYLPSDDVQLYRDSGAAFAGWGPSFGLTDPTAQAWAWINQGGASVATFGNSIYLNAPANATQSLRIRKIAAPATPYTITIMFLPLLFPENFHECGFVWRQSGGVNAGRLVTAMIVGQTTPGGLQISKWTNETTYNSDYVGILAYAPLFMGGGLVKLQLTDEGGAGNRIIAITADGKNGLPAHSVIRTDWLTPADGIEVGFFASSSNAGHAAGMTLVSWKVT